MPRTTLCENRQQKRFNYVAGMLAGGIRQQELSTKDVSKKTGIPERTITERLLHPETTRLEDLYKLGDVAGISIRLEYRDIPD